MTEPLDINDLLRRDGMEPTRHKLDRACTQAEALLWGPRATMESQEKGDARGEQPHDERVQGWSDVEPLPLIPDMPPAAPFPLDGLSPELSKAARAIQARTQAPIEICANAVLSVASLAGQAHADVGLPTGEVRPISTYIVSIARSRAQNVDR